jgi:hypothetical protein
MKNFIKTLSLVVAGITAGAAANAQVAYPYVADFENMSKTGWAADTFSLGGVLWYGDQALAGNDNQTPSRDLRNGSKSLRVRNESSNEVYTYQDFNLGIDSLSFVYARSNFSGDRTGVSPKVQISYSTDQGNTWIAFDTFDLAGIDVLTSYNARLNINSPARIKFKAVSGDAGKRFNIDDLRITAGAPATNIVLTNFTPTGTINASVNELTLTFNDDVQVGTGNITLSPVAGTPITINVATSADVTVANNVVTISNITLQPNTSYFVNYDSTAFENNNGLLSAGIYDNSTWTFTTLPNALVNFTEDFSNCGGNLLGMFTQQSLKGTAEFACDTYQDSTASFDPPYISINGGSGTKSFENEDYLITVVPIDLSDLDVQSAKLYFEEKRRFAGDGVTRGIYYSQNYNGDAASATWVAIDDNLAAISGTGTFIRRNLDITNKIDASQPFYLAFKYSSVEDTTAARNWQWSLDNIELEVKEKDSSTSINPLATNNLHVSVLGIAKSNEVKVKVATTIEMMNANFAIYDINGRPVYTQNAILKAGNQYITFSDVNLNTGMYVLRLSTSKGSKAVKFIVE